MSAKWAKGSGGPSGDECQNLVAHSLRADGFDASEDGTGRGTPIVPHPPAIAFSSKDHGADVGEVSPTLRAMPHDGSHPNAGGQVAIAFDARQHGILCYGEKSGPIDTGIPPVSVAIRGRDGGATAELGDDAAHALRSSQGGGDKPHVLAMLVRRITPLEAERLQGFPDNYTAVEYRDKPMADGPRYRMIGNAMAVNVMRWIGERIALFEEVR